MIRLASGWIFLGLLQRSTALFASLQVHAAASCPEISSFVFITRRRAVQKALLKGIHGGGSPFPPKR
jgi:hypothetical protein